MAGQCHAIPCQLLLGSGQFLKTPTTQHRQVPAPPTRPWRADGQTASASAPTAVYVSALPAPGGYGSTDKQQHENLTGSACHMAMPSPLLGSSSNNNSSNNNASNREQHRPVPDDDHDDNDEDAKPGGPATRAHLFHTLRHLPRVITHDSFVQPIKNSDLPKVSFSHTGGLGAVP
ncbi:hypothetical protein CCHR01_16758 [Colletotrichum chrysophilum]|uniref:Uncharacterized protein n=1 Tax=Colletotrichum chrysophilum TaxID=1836956 RepID=A0AAD9A3W9_9PEZI|nr:hypothetical protein CCHR01_16758 [Colletotrichum chrysophilum]